MTSVAYPGRPQLPGWIDATLSLVVGWLVRHWVARHEDHLAPGTLPL